MIKDDHFHLQATRIMSFLRSHDREEDAKFVENLVFDLTTAPSWKEVWGLRDKIKALETPETLENQGHTS